MSERHSRETESKILEAALMLFSEKGVEATSLRAITIQAGVNSAAVNYHFGSKTLLLRSLLAHCLDPLMERLGDLLDGCSLLTEKELATVFVRGIEKVVLQDGSDRLPKVVRLASSVLSGGCDESRAFLVSRYHSQWLSYCRLIDHLCSHLPQADRYWRARFLIAVPVSIFAELDLFQVSAVEELGLCDCPTDVLRRMIPFMLAGLSGWPTGDCS